MSDYKCDHCRDEGVVWLMDAQGREDAFPCCCEASHELESMLR